MANLTGPGTTSTMSLTVRVTEVGASSSAASASEFSAVPDGPGSDAVGAAGPPAPDAAAGPLAKAARTLVRARARGAPLRARGRLRDVRLREVRRGEADEGVLSGVADEGARATAGAAVGGALAVGAGVRAGAGAAVAFFGLFFFLLLPAEFLAVTLPAVLRLTVTGFDWLTLFAGALKLFDLPPRAFEAAPLPFEPLTLELAPPAVA